MTREKFPSGTFAQEVVHKVLWIAVDMWTNADSERSRISVDIDCHRIQQPGSENWTYSTSLKRTRSLRMVETSKPKVLERQTSFGEVRGTSQGFLGLWSVCTQGPAVQ